MRAFVKTIHLHDASASICCHDGAPRRYHKHRHCRSSCRSQQAILFWDEHIAPASTPVIFTDENFQQLMAMDNLVDVAMSALENDDLLPTLPSLQPSSILPLTEEDFDRYFNMNGEGSRVEPANKLFPTTLAETSIQLATLATTQATKSLPVVSQVSKARSSNLVAKDLDWYALPRKVSSDKANRRPVSAATKVAGKHAAPVASRKPQRTRKKGKGKTATFTLTGKTVERVFNGTTLTSYHCSDGVIRILTDEALEEAKIRTAAVKDINDVVEQQPSKKRRKTALANAERTSAKRPKTAHSADSGG